jgi:integrase/recombinase XerC
VEIVSSQPVSAGAVSDEMIVRLWLHGRAENTIAAYRRDVAGFFSATGKPLVDIQLADLQAFADSMATTSPATRARHLAAVRSLISFAVQMGYLTSDPGKALRIEKASVASIERILSEVEISRLIGAARNARDRVLLRLLYGCGLRASEAAALRRRDLTARKRGGEARILGKGRKLRTVEIPPALWREIAELSGSAGPDAPVIPGENGKPLHRQAVFRAARGAARRAGLEQKVSPHWLRHSHASHALDNGAPLQAVQRDLGHASATTTSRYLHKRAGDSSSQYLPGMRS